MRIDQHFQNVDNRPKVRNIEKEAAIAEYIEKVGITDLDANKNAPKRKTLRSDAYLRELAGARKKAAETKAQEEFEAALFNLDNGTAIHRQPSDRTKLVKAVKPKVAKVKPRKVKAKATKVRTAKPKTTNSRANHTKENFDASAAMIRRAQMMKTLRVGGRIDYTSQGNCTEGYTEYQQQYTDIRYLIRSKGLNIVRIQCVKTGQAYFVLDTFKRYDMPAKISGYLIDADSKRALTTALLSRQMVKVGDITAIIKVGSRSVAALASELDLEVLIVFSGRKTIGWIAIEPKPTHWWSEPLLLALFMNLFNQLGDFCQALDYKKCQAAVAERMPGASAGELADAAFAEYKAVYLNGQ